MNIMNNLTNVYVFEIFSILLKNYSA